jgi:hypothetical protein
VDTRDAGDDGACVARRSPARHWLRLDALPGDGTDLDTFTLAKVPGGYDATRPVVLDAGSVDTYSLAIGAMGHAVLEHPD